MKVSLFLAFATLFFSASIASAYTFLSLGDWGYVSSHQALVGKAMGQVAEKHKAAFVLALGDNFYNDGVANDTDPQWVNTYHKVFNHTALNVPWYSILGNHDHHLNAQAQIDYYKNKRDNRWYMPAHWYLRTFEYDGFSVDIVFIDTVIIDYAATEALLKERIAEGLMQPSALQALRDRKDMLEAQKGEQLAWIKQTLANSKADWLFVAGHYPVYSAGEHGDTKDLKTHLKPLLEQYNVDAYFCGHDHTLQHLHNNHVTYLVSGNGAKLGTLNMTHHHLTHGVVHYGFMLHTISGDKMTTSFQGNDGKNLYEFTQNRRNKH